MKNAQSYAFYARIASQLTATVHACFPHPWPDAYGDGEAEQALFDAVLASQDRVAVIAAYRKYLAGLCNGHTGFADTKATTARIGFYARPLDGKWTVLRSGRSDVPVGEVIRSLDGKPIEQLWAAAKSQISASREASARASFFFHTELLPSASQAWELDDGRLVPFTDKGQPSGLPSASLERTKGGTNILRLPDCRPETAGFAAKLLRQEAITGSLILDLRGNGGGSTPNQLIRALVQGRWRLWTNVSVLRDGLALAHGETERSFLQRPSNWFDGEEDAFDGPVAILIDPITASAAEDLILALREGHRGAPVTLVGETSAGTTGQPYMANLRDGLSFRVAAKRCLFPSGAAFEGVGFKPDIEVGPSPSALAAGQDEVLAIAIAAMQ